VGGPIYIPDFKIEQLKNHLFNFQCIIGSIRMSIFFIVYKNVGMQKSLVKKAH